MRIGTTCFVLVVVVVVVVVLRMDLVVLVGFNLIKEEMG